MPKLSEADYQKLDAIEKELYEKYLTTDEADKISFQAFLHKAAISMLMHKVAELEDQIKGMKHDSDTLIEILVDVGILVPDGKNSDSGQGFTVRKPILQADNQVIH